MGVCGNHWKWSQLRSCKVLCKSERKTPISPPNYFFEISKEKNGALGVESSHSGGDNGVLNIPAPMLSRAFQEFANGMVAYNNARKVAEVPFLFPYAQVCDTILMVHWILVPLVTSVWVTNPAWAAVFTLIQVFVLWALNLTAIEIENPFGDTPFVATNHIYAQVDPKNNGV